MSALTYPIRFCDNDFTNNATISVGSSASGYSYTNAATADRNEYWKPGGTFYITLQNQTFYINDGSDKTINLTVGTYTYSTLATHIQTRLNASSSGWTVAYNSTTTFKFTISRSSSGTLRFSQTTAALWDTIGFTGSSDTAGTSWVADEQRNHTAERYIVDFRLPMTPGFIGVIGPLAESFTVSDSATVTLKFNNMPDLWDAPDLSVTLTRTDDGIFDFLDSNTDITYRYACLEIVDRLNPLGPEGLKIGRVYIGDYVTFTTTNVAKGIDKSTVDNSEVSKTLSGVTYYNRRTKLRSYSSNEIQMPTASERREFEQMFEDLGIATSLFVSFDPYQNISTTTNEMTFYCNFTSPPKLTHVIRDYFNISFAVEEAL